MKVYTIRRKAGKVVYSVRYVFRVPGSKSPSNVTLFSTDLVIEKSAAGRKARELAEGKLRELQAELDRGISRDEFLTRHQVRVGCGRGRGVRRKQERELAGIRARLSGLKATGERRIGLAEVMPKLFSDLGLSELTDRSRVMANRHLSTMAWGRLVRDGVSKMAMSRLLREDYDVELSHQSMYKVMDKLEEGDIERLCARVADATVRLLGGETIELLLYNTTTFYFESVKADQLRRPGWSKDGKGHRIQVLFGLWQTEAGLPLGYRIFPGNTAEITTMLPMLDEIKQRCSARRLVVVADNGLLSEANLSALTAQGHDFVLASSPRLLSERQSAPLRSFDFDYGRRAYTTRLSGKSWKDRQGRQGRGPDRNYHVCWSEQSFRRDVKLHEKSLARARRSVGVGNFPLRFVGDPKVRRLLIFDGDVRVNERAVGRSLEFAGLYGYQTSLDWEFSRVREFYRQLYAIEHSFREMKSDLEVRPVFHWTERRVRAHFALCYLAFAALKRLKFLMRKRYPEQARELTVERLIEELRQLKHIKLEHALSGQQAALPLQPSELVRKVYRLLGLKLAEEATWQN